MVVAHVYATVLGALKCAMQCVCLSDVHAQQQRECQAKEAIMLPCSVIQTAEGQLLTQVHIVHSASEGLAMQVEVLAESGLHSTQGWST